MNSTHTQTILTFDFNNVIKHYWIKGMVRLEKTSLFTNNTIAFQPLWMFPLITTPMLKSLLRVSLFVSLHCNPEQGQIKHVKFNYGVELYQYSSKRHVWADAMPDTYMFILRWQVCGIPFQLPVTWRFR